MRIRSGGHDFEVTSYKSEVPFIILDLGQLALILKEIVLGLSLVQQLANCSIPLLRKALLMPFLLGTIQALVLVDT